jgi:hypothetical protein
MTKGNSTRKMREFTGLNIFLFPLALERILKMQHDVSLTCSRNLRILGDSFRGSRHGWTFGSIGILTDVRRNHEFGI